MEVVQIFRGFTQKWGAGGWSLLFGATLVSVSSFATDEPEENWAEQYHVCKKLTKQASLLEKNRTYSACSAKIDERYFAQFDRGQSQECVDFLRHTEKQIRALSTKTTSAAESLALLGQEIFSGAGSRSEIIRSQQAAAGRGAQIFAENAKKRTSDDAVWMLGEIKLRKQCETTRCPAPKNGKSESQIRNEAVKKIVLKKALVVVKRHLSEHLTNSFGADQTGALVPALDLMVEYAVDGEPAKKIDANELFWKYAKKYGQSKVMGALTGAIDQAFKKQIMDAVVTEVGESVARQHLGALLNFSSLRGDALSLVGMPSASSMGGALMWMVFNLHGDTSPNESPRDSAWRSMESFAEAVSHPDFCRYYNARNARGQGRQQIHEWREAYLATLTSRVAAIEQQRGWAKRDLIQEGAVAETDHTATVRAGSILWKKTD